MVAAASAHVIQTNIRDIFICMASRAIPIRTPMQAARAVQRLRVRRGRTQAQLAADIGRSQPTVSRLETGLTQTTIGDFLNALDVLDAEVSLRPRSAPSSPESTGV